MATQKYSTLFQPTNQNVHEVEHGLGTSDVVVQAWYADSGKAIVGATIKIKNDNVVTFDTSPPIREAFRVVVIG